MGSRIRGVIETLRCLDEIIRFCLEDITEFLWVAIHQREPTTLDLNHDSMSAAEAVIGIGQGKEYFRRLIRLERFWLFKTVTELASNHIAPHELLIAAHLNLPGVVFRVREIIRVNINQFDNPVAVGA